MPSEKHTDIFIPNILNTAEAIVAQVINAHNDLPHKPVIIVTSLSEYQ